jgi:hypothetical protein
VMDACAIQIWCPPIGAPRRTEICLRRHTCAPAHAGDRALGSFSPLQHVRAALAFFFYVLFRAAIYDTVSTRRWAPGSSFGEATAAACRHFCTPGSGAVNVRRCLKCEEQLPTRRDYRWRLQGAHFSFRLFSNCIRPSRLAICTLPAPVRCPCGSLWLPLPSALGCPKIRRAYQENDKGNTRPKKLPPLLFCLKKGSRDWVRYGHQLHFVGNASRRMAYGAALARVERACRRSERGKRLNRD